MNYGVDRKMLVISAFVRLYSDSDRDGREYYRPETEGWLFQYVSNY